MPKSCDPNSIVQKWNVNGEMRIGIFAWIDIPAGQEITFDYQFETIGIPKMCHCGTKKCRLVGFNLMNSNNYFFINIDTFFQKVVGD
jgi:hypothetical protein